MKHDNVQELALKAHTTTHYRTLFISDVHLGTKACQAEALLEFLRHFEADTIYLVGDIIDFWRIKRSPHWPQAHNDVVQKLLRKVRKGTRLVFIPGNHDEALRSYCGQHFGGVEFKLNDIHETADGRRFVVMHGDEFDVVIRYVKWLALLGDWAYVTALGVNTAFNKVRRSFGLSYWSLSAYLKQKVKKAVNYIGDFENALVGEARRQSADGVICGHIHHPAMRKFEEVLYVNVGDWVESGTAVGETREGKLEMIRWMEVAGIEREAASPPRQIDAAA
jgi:UDP-2,3-diacylglucosamine pyrophosphatase LpxH